MNNQLIAYDKFKKLKVGALFMEMGTGKTKVAIDLINYNNVDLAIFVVPFSTKENLNDEIIKWKLNCEYIIIGYETISSSDSKYLKLLNLLKNKKCFIVADESTFIKNEETKRFKRLIKIRVTML
jgi:complete genome